MEEIRERLSKSESKIRDLERRLEKERIQKKKLLSKLEEEEKKQEAERKKSLCSIVDGILGIVKPSEFEALEQFLIQIRDEFEETRVKCQKMAETADTDDTVNQEMETGELYG